MPAGAMIAIAFVHNLLRRHPACTVLLHQPLPSAPGHTDADATGRQASSPANGQAAGQVSLPDENGQLEDQGPGRPETTRGRAIEQSVAGVSETTCTMGHKARADDKHISEQVPSQHLYPGPWSSVNCQYCSVAGSPAAMLTLAHFCRTYQAWIHTTLQWMTQGGAEQLRAPYGRWKAFETTTVLRSVPLPLYLRHD